MQTQTSSDNDVYTSDVISTFNVNSLCRGLKVHSLNPHVSVPVSSRESPIFKASLRKPGFINAKRVNSKHKYHLLPTPHGLASRPNVNDSFLWHASLHQFFLNSFSPKHFQWFHLTKVPNYLLCVCSYVEP